jgi:PadR family transcriptional regulator PadR
MDLNNWRTQVRKGLLELATINILQNGKLYGYDIVQKFKKFEGLKIREGNIYAILNRLKIDGIVRALEGPAINGPPRLYFELTKHGYSTLQEMNSHWALIKKGLETVMTKEIK